MKKKSTSLKVPDSPNSRKNKKQEYRACAYCGQRFVVTPDNPYQIYCSRECTHAGNFFGR